MGMSTNDLLTALKQFDGEEDVEFDFGGYPEYIDSWRGSYDLPAMYFTLEYKPIKVKDLQKMLEQVEGKEVTGWKGGDYILSADDTLWVTPDPSKSNSTTISHLTEESCGVVLNTKYKEYY